MASDSAERALPMKNYASITPAGAELRTGVGLVLVVAGSLMAGWVFLTIFGIFRHPQNLEIFKQLVPSDPHLRTLDVGGQKVVPSEEMYSLAVYLIVGLLLLTAGTVGLGLTSAGVQALRSEKNGP